MRMRLVGSLAVAVVASVTQPSGLQAQKRQRDLITREEILKSSQKDGDLFQCIKALRPQFLEAPRGVRSLGGTGTAPLAIYVDKIRQSGGDALFLIMANTVAEVRYLDASQSQNEYGLSANGGAIVIKLYRADPDAAKKPPRVHY